MRTELFWLLSFCGFAALSLVGGLLAWPQLSAAWPSIQEQIDRFHRLHPLAKVMVLVFVAGFIAYGSTKTNQVDQAGPSELRLCSVSAVNVRPGESLQHLDGPMGLISFPTNFTVSGLSFFDLELGTGSVAYGLAWPVADPCRSDYIGIYWNCRLDGSPWTLVSYVPVYDLLASNVVCELAWPDALVDVVGEQNVPPEAVSNAFFLTAAWEMDSDHDGVEDGDELFVHHTDPYKADTDDDGLDDYDELYFGTDPNNPDTDGDALWDAWELDWWLNPLIPNPEDATADWDEDGVSNAEECRCGSSPYDEDTDNDGLIDAWEIRYGLDPASAVGDNGRNGDADHDGLTNYEELCAGTDPSDPDTDGDGLVDARDAHPLLAEGSHFGPAQALPHGANSAAYCWVGVVTDGDSLVRFSGDGPSNLPDPVFMARGGETNRVILLIGKTYYVDSNQSLEIVAKSDDLIEVSNVEPDSFTVVWPVTFSTLEGNGSGFMMRVVPSGLGGTFTWTQHCCTITGYGNQFWWAHERYCCCGGCYAYGFYSYEGYEKECTGGHCGCPYYDDDDPYESQEDDGPYAAGASVEFSESVVIFEDAYTNKPDEVVARQSTRTTLSCIVHGGETGGTATFSIENGDKLIACSGGSLPVTRFVPPLQKVEFEIVYEGKLPSGSARDIKAKADFTERVTGTRHSTRDDRLTSVNVELEAVYVAPTNHNQGRHVYGVGEKVRFKITPALTDVILATRKLDNGDDDPDSEYELFGHSDRTDGGAVCVYTCPISANYHPPIEISLSDVTYRPDIEIVEPDAVITPYAGWGANVTDMFYTGNRKCWPEGVVGAACLMTTNYIGPMYVSFQGIAVSELPCTEEDIITGCFTNGHHRTHTGGANGAGAGKAYYIQPGNFWFVDGARMTAPETNWIPGSTLSWKIPVGWHRKLGDSPNGYDAHFPDYEERFNGESRILMIGGRNDVYKQIWHIDEQGTYRTDKFGHWISRSRDCVIKLDGITIQTGHP